MVTRDIVQRLLNVINDTRRRVNTLESREYVLLNATQTLTNKTLTTPTIGDFSNAQHSHADAAGGGQLSLTAAVSGVLPPANGGTGVNNDTRTLTINTNSGTLAFSGAGFTLTVPATGTAALLGTANVFTATQTMPNNGLVVGTNQLLVSGGNVGIGTTNPAGKLDVVVDGNGGIFRRFGGAAPMVFERANGSISSPTQVNSVVTVGAFSAQALDDTGVYRSIGVIRFNSAAAITSTSSPGIITIQTTPIGSTTASDRVTIVSDGNVGIGTTSPSAQLHVDQSSASGAKPTLRLRQADLSEEFIRFDTTVGAGNAINTTALGTYYGRVRVWVEGVGAKWLALYD